ncbi:hypothetical protein ACJIZ3_023807 [Penstemon smallii]|uniref:COP1-interacting protein 7 n=1 Tax=Penstemon smallii TaxID=265156 RepID=A0ABD3TRG8_9LAMI
MKLDTPLDYALFQLSPKRSRCELFVSSDGSTEKLASGLLKPFVANLKVAEEQVASAARSIKLEVGRRRNEETWFTKGTVERFVRFVSTPEVVELVNTFDAEMSQLESARRIYSQGAGDQLSGGGGSGVIATDDATKKELLRAIDVRLVAVQQDLSNACARAIAAGFDIDSVSDLQMFADRFGAHRLNDACGKFISIRERRPDLPWKSGSHDRAIRSSYGSDMSIDDDDPPSPSPHQEPATCQQPKSLRLERDGGELKNPNETVPENDGKNESSITPEPIPSSQHTRRLSVQDRISLFENKQKESSGGKPVVVTKSVELRRLSSDVSSSGAAAAAEKAVLRRWSGASDMSIDLTSEKKNVESPLCTPSSSIAISNSNDDTLKTVKPEMKIIPSLVRVGDGGLKEGSFNNPNSNLGSSESDGLKDKGSNKTQSSSFISKTEDQEITEDKFKTLSGSENEGMVRLNDQEKLTGSHSFEELSGGPHKHISANPLTRARPSGNKIGGHVEVPNQRNDSLSKDESVMQARLESGVFAGSRIREAFAARYNGIEGDSSSAHQDVRLVVETEGFKKKESHTSSIEDSEPERMISNRQRSAAEHTKKTQVKHYESSFSGNNRTPSFHKGVTEAQEGFDSFSTPPPEQAQIIRQSKGNQELNDELKVKANELEKLFAEHKLRGPGDQFNSSNKGKSGDTQPTVNSKKKTKVDAAPVVKTIESQNSGDALNNNFSELSVSEGSRGKSYDRYMQKRDAKLKEEWGSNRVEKEARLKSLQDSLERNRSEMKGKFLDSADRQDSVSSARQRAERLRSYNSRSFSKKEQQHLDFGDSEEDDEPQGKKLLLNNRSLQSSIPRTLAAPVPRSATKISTNNSGKRRMQPENPLAQSVPNFSDLRKENTKPSHGGSKVTRLQTRNYARSKSTAEEAALVKEDKSRRSQSLRKNSENQSEFKEMSPLDPDGVALKPIKIDEEIQKSVGTRPFLKKGSRASFVSQASIARQKASVGSDPINNVEENDNMPSESDDFVSTVKDEGDEEFETLQTEVDNGETELVNSGSENGDDILTFSHVDKALGSSQIPTEINPSIPVESMQDWPGESPISWNSRSQNPFSYPNEISDVDASVDSPLGSPASWNLHSLNQIETDAARMRKKWGTAGKSMLVAHSSSNSSRKDMTRGLKRFLKFGRKTRGSENLVDWISATTSEGDDDTDDGRDVANRSSEDLRKSRMGFSQAKPSDDCFNENEFFNESGDL